MRITKELRAKIDRSFSQKKEEIVKKYREERTADFTRREERALEFLTTTQQEVEPALFEALLCSITYSCEIENAANTIANRYPDSDFIKELNTKEAAEKKAVELQKEEFLIAISYEKDLDGIKEVFGKFGIEF